MGGILKACGCFDGPLSEENSGLVSIRCPEHYDELPLLGHRLLRMDADGKLWTVTMKKRPKMSVPRGRRR